MGSTTFRRVRLLPKRVFREYRQACFSSHLSNVQKDHSRSYFRKTGILFCGSVVGILLARTKEIDDDSPASSLKVIPSYRLDEVDQLYNGHRHTERILEQLLYLLTELNKEYPKQDEVLWRMARCYYEQGKKLKSKKMLEINMFADEFVNAALVINKNNIKAHQWKAIISNSLSESESTNAHISFKLETVRYHLERAVDLNPYEATSMTMLGAWHVDVLELTLSVRRVCFVMLFSESLCDYLIPKFLVSYNQALSDASYEKALELLLKAEEMAPLKWNKNIMLIGKTYLRMGDYINATHYLELTLELKVVTDEDGEVLAEAEKLLKEINYYSFASKQ